MGSAHLRRANEYEISPNVTLEEARKNNIQRRWNTCEHSTWHCIHHCQCSGSTVRRLRARQRETRKKKSERNVLTNAKILLRFLSGCWTSDVDCCVIYPFQLYWIANLHNFPAEALPRESKQQQQGNICRANVVRQVWKNFLVIGRFNFCQLALFLLMMPCAVDFFSWWKQKTNLQ